MKIRTDFVTNSSSACSAEIMIDNPVLLEILARYRDLGAFGEGETEEEIKIGSGSFQITSYTDFSPGDMPKEMRGFSEVPALYYYAENVYSLRDSTPKSLDQLVLSVIELFEYEAQYCEFNKNMLNELKMELQLRKSEIEQVYTRVYWDYELITNEHEYDFDGDVEETWKFSYNPIDGEKFTYLEKNSETGEIIEEK